MLFSINSGLLDACVLAILSRGDEYGYKLTQEVKQVMTISESTLYPVLRRLQKTVGSPPMTSRSRGETGGITGSPLREKNSMPSI